MARHWRVKTGIIYQDMLPPHIVGISFGQLEDLVVQEKQHIPTLILCKVFHRGGQYSSDVQCAKQVTKEISLGHLSNKSGGIEVRAEQL